VAFIVGSKPWLPLLLIGHCDRGRRTSKKLVLLAVVGIAFAAPASARQVCNHDPVCQAKRDGVSVESKVRAEAARRQQRSAPRAVRGDCRMRGTC
jgi:hypothetical protein